MLTVKKFVVTIIILTVCRKIAKIFTVSRVSYRPIDRDPLVSELQLKQNTETELSGFDEIRTRVSHIL